MQNPPVNASNVAVCCKLWPNPFWAKGPKIWDVSPSPIFSWGNSSAPGATPKPLEQPLCTVEIAFVQQKWSLKVLWELHRSFLMAQGTLWELVRLCLHFLRKYVQILMLYTVWEPARDTSQIKRIKRIKRIRRK